MRLPQPRGELSSWLSTVLTGSAPPYPVPGPAVTGEAWHDEDLQLALWCCYELHYRGFGDVDDSYEWDLDVLAFRRRLEERWEQALLDRYAPGPVNVSAPVSRLLRQLVDADEGTGLARYLQRTATVDQFREFVRLRSVYQLKEADPHSFGIPRLGGAAKAALVEIQADEYGGGMLRRMHTELFRATMRWLDLDDGYGHYVDTAPAVALALSNAMSLFGLHRRRLGALVGHLAALEMTSTDPNRRYAAGVRRLGGDDRAAGYFDEHVEADAVHEQIAAHGLCDGYVREHPHALADVLFGARCCLGLDRELARHLLSGWEADTGATPGPAGSAVGGVAGRAEPGDRVPAVAERFQTGTTAPAQGDRAAAGVDRRAVL